MQLMKNILMMPVLIMGFIALSLYEAFSETELFN